MTEQNQATIVAAHLHPASVTPPISRTFLPEAVTEVLQEVYDHHDEEDAHHDAQNAAYHHTGGQDQFRLRGPRRPHERYLTRRTEDKNHLVKSLHIRYNHHAPNKGEGNGTFPVERILTMWLPITIYKPFQVAVGAAMSGGL